MFVYAASGLFHFLLESSARVPLGFLRLGRCLVIFLLPSCCVCPTDMFSTVSIPDYSFANYILCGDVSLLLFLIRGSYFLV